MEQEYKIDWIETKQSAKGTTYHRASLKDAQGVITNDVAIFAGFTGGELNLGGTVRGVLSSKPYNGKPSYTLNSPGEVSGSGARRAGNSVAIEKAQERKESSINRFADRKEHSIALAGAQRDAVLLVTTFYKDAWSKDPILSASETELDLIIKRKVVEFRDWIMSDKFTETTPF